MKKFSLLIILSLLLVLAFSTAQVAASYTDLADQEKPDKTPGAKATEKALERLADPGKPENPGKPDKNQGKTQHFRGVVKEVTETSLILTMDKGGEQTFLLDPETEIEIKIPTMDTVTDVALLVPGVKVSVWAVQDEVDPAVVDAQAQLTAVKIHVTPGKPVKVRRVGVVTVYEINITEVDGEEVKPHVTILANDGVEYTFVLAEEIKFLPASLVMTDPATELIGKRVTIISPRNVVGVDHIARGIVVHLDDDGEDVEDTD